MAVKYIFCRFKPTRGLAQAIANRNPTLLDGECVFESDTGRYKRGDGSTKWNDLSYANANATEPRCVVSVQEPDSEIWIDVDMETVSIGKEDDAYVEFS